MNWALNKLAVGYGHRVELTAVPEAAAEALMAEADRQANEHRQAVRQARQDVLDGPEVQAWLGAEQRVRSVQEELEALAGDRRGLLLESARLVKEGEDPTGAEAQLQAIDTRQRILQGRLETLRDHRAELKVAAAEALRHAVRNAGQRARAEAADWRQQAEARLREGLAALLSEYIVALGVQGRCQGLEGTADILPDAGALLAETVG